MRTRIQSFVNNSTVLNNVVLPFINTSVGQGVFDNLMTANQAAYPEYVQEVKGMAAGAGFGDSGQISVFVQNPK